MKHAHIILLGVLALSGMFQVASAYEYYLTPKNVNECPPSWKKVESQNECILAGAALLSKAGYNAPTFAWINISTAPERCIFNAYNSRWRWNKASSDAKNPSIHLLCKAPDYTSQPPVANDTPAAAALAEAAAAAAAAPTPPRYTPANCGQLQEHYTTGDCCSDNGEKEVSNIFIENPL